MEKPSTGVFKRTVWYLLFLVPYIGGLWISFFNTVEPSVFGIPFFYWFQFVWIIFTAILTGLAYLARV